VLIQQDLPVMVLTTLTWQVLAWLKLRRQPG
jgi:hypothetical protein